MEIGFIGLGKMGGGLARNLILAGNHVQLYDINEEAVTAILKNGGTKADSLDDLAYSVDVLFTSLPLPIHLTKMLVEEGLLEKMKKDSIVIDVSTINPQTATEIKNEANRFGVHFLACPLGKGPKQAYDGTLPIFSGGDKLVYQRIENILNQIGEPFYLGDVEQSTAFKLISNMIGMTNLLAMSEGLKLGFEAGIDPGQLKELLHDTGADSAQLNLRGPLVLGDDYEPMFSVNLALKDVGLGLEMAKSYNNKTELSQITTKYLEEASKQGYGDRDCAAVFKVY
ncbi:NAD(P)-dependent oxidoreductase [Oceanobacillus timonensis]|uniref:NAD(P)-dependent oxidoreductase n=1 Tax=Oceanobacillus timonensis TaxID=1926285 RepID=UPI0009B96936|nr:NAD(P)-dependent oxidoreductase [Oceanobacillus timonensis]